MKRRILIVGLSLLTASLLTVNFACRKPEQKSNIGLHKLNATLTLLPAMENGMLSFKDIEEYNKYQDQILNTALDLMNTPDANGETPTFDDALKQIEEQLNNFISYRSVSVDQFEMENINGWEKVIDIPESHKLSDALLESTLNQFGAVIIGHDIVFHVNKDLVFTFPKEEMNTIYSILIEMPQNVRQNGISATKWIGNVNNTLKVRATVLSDGDRGVLGDPIPLGTYFSFSGANGIPKIVGNECDPMTFTLKGFFVAKNNDINALVNVTFSINWGDGTTSTGTGPSGVTEAVNHTYATPGFYYPVLTVNCNYSGLTEVLTHNFPSVSATNVISSCTGTTTKEKNKKAYSVDGKAMINCKVIFRSNFFANNIQSETEYYEKNSNGKWRHVKTGSGKAISARVYGFVGLSSCANSSYQDLNDLETNKKTAFSVKRWNAAFANSSGAEIFTNEINSYHSAKYNNETIELSLKVSKCD